ncbi:L-serine ammonia-lyase [Ramlibacter alkalitolerans]|uniref:L-serine dehydratase n=1 Tax=Ramlibacter alkalitolerans TaxID=2039631 RepID=A0ABS1JP03_9BURK|nr:L-serine ammonia-lyase [Ramlibacter alkalitolerans]MBL0425250.1 L-serine ammonia-lyase [Ramlibacter alkalitolerans]
MPVSVFDLFKVGIGPSSSHTVGPMRIALRFVRALSHAGRLQSVAGVEVHLYGSLALTGRGHATDQAVLLGLMGYDPETVDTAQSAGWLAAVGRSREIRLLGQHSVAFDEREDLVFHPRECLELHPNGMRLLARGSAGQLLADQTSFSVGGGFVATEQELRQAAAGARTEWPHPYASAEQLLRICADRGLSIAQLALENELALRPRPVIDAGLDRIRQVMFDCMDRGLAAHGALPGRLGVQRRAAVLREALERGKVRLLGELDWVNAYAVAVNEENAAGGRVVTAPTNGAAGVVPAVLRFHERFHAAGDASRSHDFLLTAAAIGALYKENASISGAEVGCQGEVGVAASMAAAGLAAVLGGSPEQVENAAEIAMEHHLGMTCDPVAGLVQVPCIERNAMGAVKAINAARLALAGDGTHLVTLDRVIATMKATGADMHHKYKETSLGGLAVNVVAC